MILPFYPDTHHQWFKDGSMSSSRIFPGIHPERLRIVKGNEQQQQAVQTDKDKKLVAM